MTPNPEIVSREAANVQTNVSAERERETVTLKDGTKLTLKDWDEWPASLWDVTDGEPSDYDCNGEGARAIFSTLLSLQRQVSEQAQWVACAEKMPEEHGTYLVCGRDDRVVEARYGRPIGAREVGWWVRGWAEKWAPEYPTFWMPLPAPPTLPAAGQEDEK